jgi:hypothetical protein
MDAAGSHRACASEPYLRVLVGVETPMYSTPALPGAPVTPQPTISPLDRHLREVENRRIFERKRATQPEGLRKEKKPRLSPGPSAESTSQLNLLRPEATANRTDEGNQTCSDKGQGSRLGHRSWSSSGEAGRGTTTVIA